MDNNNNNNNNSHILYTSKHSHRPESEGQVQVRDYDEILATGTPA